ncbi:MAG: hypothetical protein GC137_00810 [Alphaproteobacteria bacterium]|nr:hypothetical protein [Alphaproteobacteria bacterium]
MLFAGLILGAMLAQLSGEEFWSHDAVWYAGGFLIFLGLIFNPVFLAFHLHEKLADMKLLSALNKSKKVLLVLFLIDILGWFILINAGLLSA